MSERFRSREADSKDFPRNDGMTHCPRWYCVTAGWRRTNPDDAPVGRIVRSDRRDRKGFARPALSAETISQPATRDVRRGPSCAYRQSARWGAWHGRGVGRAGGPRAATVLRSRLHGNPVAIAGPVGGRSAAFCRRSPERKPCRKRRARRQTRLAVRQNLPVDGLGDGAFRGSAAPGTRVASMLRKRNGGNPPCQWLCR